MTLSHEQQFERLTTAGENAQLEPEVPLYAEYGGSNTGIAAEAEHARAAGGTSTGVDVVQNLADGPEPTSAAVRDAASEGIAGPASALPYRDQIQASFGRHDISGVHAHLDEHAAEATERMGATAFASGNDVGFAGAPDLHTAAHEAAHVVQQRGGVQLKGGVGEVGDEYEQNADQVADHVVQGKSAEALLDSVADSSAPGASGNVVQHDKKKFAAMRARFERPANKKQPPPRPKKKPAKKVAPARTNKPSSKLSHVKARSKKAPAIPTVTTVEPKPVTQVEQTPVVEEELLEEIPPESNEEAKTRIEKGMVGVDHLKTAVGKSKTAWTESQNAPEPEPEPEVAPQTTGGGGGALGTFFRGLRDMFKSKSSTTDLQEVMDNLPQPETQEPEIQPDTTREISHEYDEAKGKLDTLKDSLVENTGRLDTAISTKEYVAQHELCDAKIKVDGTAEEIRGKVEQLHVSQLQDVGVGIRDGDDAMLNAALDRGNIDINALKIVKILGKGGSGATVFTARYMNMVALAFKSKGLTNLGGQVDKVDDQHEMRREQRIMRELGKHPNILRSGGDTDRPSRGHMNPGYVMEKTAFGSLKDVFAGMTTSKMSTIDRLKVTRFLIRQAFNACSELHANDYVHSDIKDENFLLDKGMQVKMMDFGLTHKSHEQDPDQFEGNKRSGTSGYMAPEVAAGAIPERESDIWSLGETLLKGVFDWDSVDFLNNAKSKDFGKETRRPGMSDDAWQKNLKAKANTELAKKDQAELKSTLISFVQAAMAKKPEDRISAANALNHPFLKLSAEDETDAIELLKGVT